MAILRSLRLAGTTLLVLTVLCIFVLPDGIVPMMVGIALAGLTALDLLVVFVLTLVRDHSFRGLVQALVALSLILMLGGGIGSMAQAGSYYIQLEEGETAMLAGRGMDGYALTLESGELGVLVYGEGEGTLKKFVRRGNAIILQPFNPAYQPQVILGEDLERLHVVGKVVETKAKW